MSRHHCIISAAEEENEAAPIMSGWGKHRPPIQSASAAATTARTPAERKAAVAQQIVGHAAELDRKGRANAETMGARQCVTGTAAV
jgi:hypothetical protein